MEEGSDTRWYIGRGGIRVEDLSFMCPREVGSLIPGYLYNIVARSGHSKKGNRLKLRYLLNALA